MTGLLAKSLNLVTNPEVIADFWRSVRKHPGPTACWVWTGALTEPTGYGVFPFGPEKLAHRLSWRIHRGPIPPGWVICHRCDNRPCVRPKHLFLGTYEDNMRDMVAKGRHHCANPRRWAETIRKWDRARGKRAKLRVTLRRQKIGSLP